MPSSTAIKATRRGFLKASTAAIPYALAGKRSLADTTPNERVRVGCIGVGGHGRWDATQHARLGDVVAVCDVDTSHLDRIEADANINRVGMDRYVDYRRLLDRTDIDVVSITTPDHWHVKMAIEALEAGKHVFCQKPLTLTLEQNQLVRRASAKHSDRVFMVGTQQRADGDRFLRAVNLVRKGLLGPIKKVTVGIDGGTVGGPFAATEAPSHFDWDRWLGPAPLVEYRRERTHGSFRWWYEYSGGKFTDWGAHHVDIATWALDKHRAGCGPTRIDGSDAKHPVELRDGQPVVDDHFNTSHDFAVSCFFEDGVQMDITSRADNGILFEGERGRLFVNRGRIAGTPIEEEWDRELWTDDGRRALFKGKPFEGHKENFYRCIREGGEPVSDVVSHTQMLNTCHLAVIAARLGQTIQWDPVNETIVGNPTASAMMSRPARAEYALPVV
ncbi:MAG: Gfo/Idh/MocA family oxidoreductase [Planctomycetota bacterium]